MNEEKSNTSASRVGNGIAVAGLAIAAVLLITFLVVASTVDMVSCPECRGLEILYGLSKGADCPTCRSTGKVTIFGRLLYPREKARRDSERVAFALAAAVQAEKPEHVPSLGVGWVMQKPATYTIDATSLPSVEVVDERSTAYRAGLRAGDVVKRPSLEQKRHYLGSEKAAFEVMERWDDAMPGDIVDVTIERAGKEATLKVPLSCKKCGNADACPFRRKQDTK